MIDYIIKQFVFINVIHKYIKQVVYETDIQKIDDSLDAEDNKVSIYKDIDKDAKIKFIPKEFSIPSLDNFTENKENFRILINLLPNPTQQVTLLLALGYVEDKCYFLDEISNLLGFEIVNIINDGLSNIACFSSITTNGVESARKQLKMEL